MKPPASRPPERRVVNHASRRIAALGLLVALLFAAGPRPHSPLAQDPPGPPHEELDLSRVYPEVVDGPTLRPAPGWPLWLVDFETRARTNETSAITFLGYEAPGVLRFLLADDAGFAEHLPRLQQVGQQDHGLLPKLIEYR